MSEPIFIEGTIEGIIYSNPENGYSVIDLVNTMSVMPAKFVVEDSGYEIQYAVFNSKVLIPYDVFKLVGCEVLFNKDTYVTTISKNDTTLEIIPNIIGMRKNQAEG